MAVDPRCEQVLPIRTDENGPAERGKGSASPPRRRWKEMAGQDQKFEDAQYPVDTADVYGTFSFVGI